MGYDGKLVANLGDRNPFEHGGYFVFKMRGGGYEGHHWDSPDDDDPDAVVHVYRFTIADDGARDLTWIKPRDVAATHGVSEADLLKDARSDNVCDRAFFYRDVGSHYGFDNLDSYPEEFTQRELEKFYGPAYRGLLKRHPGLIGQCGER